MLGRALQQPRTRYRMLDVNMMDLQLDKHEGAFSMEPQIQHRVAEVSWAELLWIELVLVPDQFEVHPDPIGGGEVESAIPRYEQEECQHPKPVATERQAPEHVRDTSFRRHTITEAGGVVVHCLGSRRRCDEVFGRRTESGHVVTNLLAYSDRVL